MKKLLSTFKVEAEEHVNAISNGLIELEKAPTIEEERKIIETVFREAHSLKGAARSVNMREIEKICQAQESVFAAFKREEIVQTTQLLDILHQTVDALGNLISSLEAAPTARDKKQIAELIRLLQSEAVPHAESYSSSDISTTPSESNDLSQDKNQKLDDEIVEPTPTSDNVTSRIVPATEEKPVQSKTVRISTAKLDTLLFQSESLLSSKLTLRQRLIELQQLSVALNTWKKEWVKVQPDVRIFRHAEDGKHNNGHGVANSSTKRLMEFFDQSNSLLKKFETELATLTKSIEQDHLSLGGMVDQLLEDMKKVLMLPASSLLETFPRVVRDLARNQGKEVELVMRGGEIEIDRRVLEEIKDPLIHLVRNSIDHGIEKPDERAMKKKPTQGMVMLTVTQKGSNEVEIEISDNGAGISAAKVRAAALKSGIVSQSEIDRLSEQESLLLILRSGVSTSPIITDISGRGLGMAIVQEKVEKLGGTLTLESQADTGTLFRIRLPLTLTTFRGILVRIEKHFFVLPTTNVKRVLRVQKEEIKTVENRETIQLNGEFISLLRLGDVLGIAKQKEADVSTNFAPAVVLGSAEKRIAFLVDEILDEREVLVKNLGKQLIRVRNIAGATVLGDGRVTPVLNVTDLIVSAIKTSASHVSSALTSGKEAKRKSILIAEDSITARTLLKNILESAGYDVKTAVDGVEAMTELKSGEFDLVVSDVEMPRMNGFDLTANIRADKKLAELPVILVTSLDSREDRERGIDAGANAYIVKSSFDQSNLLETIRRII